MWRKQQSYTVRTASVSLLPALNYLQSKFCIDVEIPYASHGAKSSDDDEEVHY